jgi:hypothetical protein
MAEDIQRTNAELAAALRRMTEQQLESFKGVGLVPTVGRIEVERN